MSVAWHERGRSTPKDGIEETLTYCDFPDEHRTRIRKNNVIEWLNREIRRRTRVVGRFPDGNPALMPVCARLSPCSGCPVGQQEIHEHEALGGGAGRRFYCRLTSFGRSLQTILRIDLDSTDFDLYVTADEIATAAHLKVEDVETAITELPLTVKEDGVFKYRPEGSCSHIPPLLTFFK